MIMVVIGNRQNWDVRRILLGIFGGVLFGIFIIIMMILLIPLEPQLMYFFAGSIVSIWIWFAGTSINKKSEKNIEKILKKVEEIERKLE